jgi:hypothetical protein
MNSSPSAESVLAAHLQPGELLQWSEQPGPSRAGARELKSALVPGVVAGLLAAFISSSAPLPSFFPWLLFVAVAGGVTWVFYSAQHLPGGVLYGLTDRRLLILQDGKLRAFHPGDVTYLDAEPCSDGTVDLVWGDDSPAPRDRRLHRSSSSSEGGRVRMQFSIKQRRLKRGFLGLSSAEPAQSLIRELRGQDQRKAAAEALGTLVPPADAVAPVTDAAVGDGVTAGVAAGVMAGVAAPTTAGGTQGWRTLREPETGFAMEVPAGWQAQSTRLRRYKVIGLPIELPPKWSDALAAGWNQLKIEMGLEDAVLQVNLNPPNMPPDVEGVLTDRWAKVLNLAVVESNPDVRIGALQGFSVTHDLQGVGPKIGAGPIKVGMGTMKAELLQTQHWLRGPGHVVHTLFITPTHAHELRSVIAKVLESLRFEMR